MRIITARRISQIFFVLLFIWFCVVATLGERWWQLRGWPVNWLLQLDPLHALGLWLATHTLYRGMLWGVLTLALTFVLGRFFCGWICPFGALQQLMGVLGKKGLKPAQRIVRNRPHAAQRIKYWVLLFVLALAAADMMDFVVSSSRQASLVFWGGSAAAVVVFVALHVFQWIQVRRDVAFIVVALMAGGLLFEWMAPQARWLAVSLQTGLLDPIALMHRSVNLVVVPLVDGPLKVTSALPRVYPGSFLIGLLFLLFLLLSLRVPRFYCRFVCPLGALFGLCSRWSIWRIGQAGDGCTHCLQCERDCEGACAPAETIRISECVLCLNCLDRCGHGVMGYHLAPSAAGESASPDLSRRQVMVALAAGLVSAPVMRLDGSAGADWNPNVIRPPGALSEEAFLARCIKCGQCMRICPTNVIHPAGLQGGLEGLWTPMLNFRVGSSGCQHNCVACSFVCPTAALRPISVDERMGRGAFAGSGPLRIGMAFVDRGRCLPWAMDTPCIVCQENCPVSPKAIFTREEFRPVRGGLYKVKTAEGHTLVLQTTALRQDQYATGDYFCRYADEPPCPIAANKDDSLTLGLQPVWSRLPEPGQPIEVLIRLQQPYVDPTRCIGCGVCEHECPVQGRRAIRVTAENESRNLSHRLVLP